MPTDGRGQRSVKTTVLRVLVLVALLLLLMACANPLAPEPPPRWIKLCVGPDTVVSAKHTFVFYKCISDGGHLAELNTILPE